jgi:hypothetical protein
MTASRHRSAWIWLAVAAISLASLARAEAGIQNAKAFTGPVLAFLAGSQNASTGASTGMPHVAQARTARQSRAMLLHSYTPGVWIDLLPVLFVGLLLPLSLLSPRSALCIGRAAPAPVLPFSFQRPPPFQLL